MDWPEIDILDESQFELSIEPGYSTRSSGAEPGIFYCNVYTDDVLYISDLYHDLYILHDL